MIDDILKRITDLPNWLNNILVKANILGRFVYGLRYVKYKKSLHITGVPNDLLLKSVNYAIKFVPYYRTRYTAVDSVESFRKKIRFISRVDLNNERNLFISDCINWDQFYEGTTGGTSGKPLKLVIPKNRYIVELATVHTLWNSVGWNYHKRGVIRNHMLDPDKAYKVNPLTKEYIFDAFRLNQSYVQTIFKVLKNENIEFVQAYPSSAYLFCKLCSDQNLDISFLKAFLTSSEPVFEYQYDFIKNYLGINIFNFYGHSEKLIIAGNCLKPNYFHFESSYGYAELIDTNNVEICVPGSIGELVGTTYRNTGMPLIRYKTGDLAEYVGDICPICGKKGLIVKNIQGHWDKNLIYKNDGTYITTTSLNLHSSLYKYIDGLQYIQKEKGQLTILIIRNELFKDDQYDEFESHFKKAMGANNRIEIKFVDKLIQQQNGKFSLLISNLVSDDVNR